MVSAAAGSSRYGRRENAEVLCLEPLRTLHDLELDLLPLCQRPATFRLNDSVMAEDIGLPVVLNNESKAYCRLTW